MPGIDENCGNCYFMKPQTRMVGNVMTVVPCCRCTPPTTTIDLHSMPARWYEVDPDQDWCGQWKKA